MKRLLVLAAMLCVCFAPLVLSDEHPSSGSKTEKKPATEAKPSAASPLEGTSWAVKVTPDDATMKKGEKAFDDTIIFKDNECSMSECVKVGFGPSKYTATKAGEKWNFKTMQTSDSMGKSEWAAVITGDSIKGTLKSTKKDGTVLKYTFEGTKAASTPAT